MKECIGKKVEFVMEGIGAFQAKVVADRKDMVMVKGEKDEFSRRLIKSKIISFMPLEKTVDDVNMIVLACQNPSIGCPGVKFVKEGGGFSQNDFKMFMGPCSSRCSSCMTASLGELRSVSGEVLKEMMGGTMFGDYPQEKREEENE